jgi:hypothetical protein
MSDLCLTLLCPPALEERVLDTLLMIPEIVLFSSSRAAVHGVHPERLSASEQVLGLAVMTQIQALLHEADRTRLLARLKDSFAGTGLRYWLTPVIETGEFA